MAATALDCPRCGARGSSFELVREYPSLSRKAFWETLCICGVCKEPVLVRFADMDEISGKKSAAEPMTAGNAAPLAVRYSTMEVSPSPEVMELPEHIPRNVATPLKEAEESYLDGRYSAAGSCYRKAIERAVRAINPDGSGTLNARIRELEKNGLLPNSMIELLDQVRLFGNASMHEDEEDPTEGDCTAARDFCKLFLTYAFTLPAKVSDAKERTSIA